MATTRNFADVIRKQLASDPELVEELERVAFYRDLAKKLYDMRKSAGLTQSHLAKLIGTKQSVISRIESSAYEGQRSISVFWRVARVLKMKVRIETYPAAQPVPSIGLEKIKLQWAMKTWNPAFSEVCTAQSG